MSDLYAYDLERASEQIRQHNEALVMLCQLHGLPGQLPMQELDAELTRLRVAEAAGTRRAADIVADAAENCGSPVAWGALEKAHDAILAAIPASAPAHPGGEPMTPERLAAAGRHCKSCRHLKRIPDTTSARCGWFVAVEMPWPHKPRVIAPDTIIAPRHYIPGDHYPEALGSTSDWTEIMDCQMWQPQAETT